MVFLDILDLKKSVLSSINKSDYLSEILIKICSCLKLSDIFLLELFSLLNIAINENDLEEEFDLISDLWRCYINAKNSPYFKEYKNRLIGIEEKMINFL